MRITPVVRIAANAGSSADARSRIGFTSGRSAFSNWIPREISGGRIGASDWIALTRNAPSWFASCVTTGISGCIAAVIELTTGSNAAITGINAWMIGAARLMNSIASCPRIGAS